jgi:hypothetical protein
MGRRARTKNEADCDLSSIWTGVTELDAPPSLWAWDNVNKEKQTCGAQYLVLSIFHPMMIIKYFILFYQIKWMIIIQEF